MWRSDITSLKRICAGQPQEGAESGFQTPVVAATPTGWIQFQYETGLSRQLQHIVAIPLDHAQVYGWHDRTLERSRTVDEAFRQRKLLLDSPAPSSPQAGEVGLIDHGEQTKISLAGGTGATVLKILRTELNLVVEVLLVSSIQNHRHDLQLE